MSIRLVIKGDKDAAERAITDHGIGEFVFKREVVWESGWRDTICLVEDYHLPEVGKWFVGEPHETAPYPEGTLLWYVYEDGGTGLCGTPAQQAK